MDIFGEGAYQGVYDIYVYGKDAGEFKLNWYGTTTTKSVTGGVAAGTFVEGGNYVVFSNVDLNDTYSGNIYLNYTNKLNALQFVKKKQPVAVTNGTLIRGWKMGCCRRAKHQIGRRRRDLAPDTFGTEPNHSSATMEIR